MLVRISHRVLQTDVLILKLSRLCKLAAETENAPDPFSSPQALGFCSVFMARNVKPDGKSLKFRLNYIIMIIEACRRVNVNRQSMEKLMGVHLLNLKVS